MARFTRHPAPASRTPKFVRQALVVQPSATATSVEPTADSATGNLSFAVFCFYTFVMLAKPQDYFPVLEVLRPALMLTIVSLLVTLFTGSGSITRVFRYPATKLYLFFFAAMIAGIPFSIHRRHSFEFVFYSYIVNVIYFLLLLANVDSVLRLKRLLFVVTVSALALSFLALQFGSFAGGRYFARMGLSRRGRMIGMGFDPNDLAFVVLSLLSFSISVLLGVFNRFTKTIALTSVLLSVLLVLFSGSRGGMVGFALFMTLFLFIPIKGLPKTAKLALVLVLALVAGFNADKINVERYLTMTDLQDDYNQTEYGRVGIWTRGLQMFWENPLTGVGAGRFGEGIGTLRKDEHLTARWQAPHNAYVQVLAELGVFASVTFLLLIIGTISSLVAVVRKRSKSLAPELRTTAAILSVGFVSEVVTAFFLSQAYSILFTLSFAVAAALAALVDSQKTVSETDVESPLPVANRWNRSTPFRSLKHQTH